MAILLKARKAPYFFTLLFALALVVSSGYASRDCPGSQELVTPQNDPKCEVMVPCGPYTCVPYCLRIGLRGYAFCTLKPDMQVYCCCKI
ncbi:hypothetical protein QOZ80_9AG0687760 [Eleusine coracana subsp. coracana]|nr:hypothetical protein QOZ80_9AG0687760 [Eleusine coracana subsp. coracana]